MTPAELRERFPVLTESMGPEDVEAFLGALEPRSFPKGAQLSTYGDPADSMYLVLSGALSIHAEEAGEDLLLGRAEAGAAVGEVGLIEPGPSSATVQALEDVETLALSHSAFERLCESRPGAASAVLQAVSLELVRRLRASAHDIVRRVDDHHWMRVRAEEDRPGWLGRIAGLLGGRHGDRS